MAFGKSVEMAGKDRLQIEVAKTVEQPIRIKRPVCYIRAQRKMGENSRGLSPIQSREVIVQPLKSLRLNHGFLVALPFAGIQADELPAFMPKIIVKPQSKSLSIVSSTTLVWSVGVIVVADDWIDRRAQNGEKFLNCFEVPAL